MSHIRTWNMSPPWPLSDAIPKDHMGIAGCSVKLGAQQGRAASALISAVTEQHSSADYAPPLSRLLEPALHASFEKACRGIFELTIGSHLDFII